VLRELFETMGFPAVAHHRSKDVTLHRQRDINIIIDAEPKIFAQDFAREHGVIRKKLNERPLAPRNTRGVGHRDGDDGAVRLTAPPSAKHRKTADDFV
jgi:hypothetical protein